MTTKKRVRKSRSRKSRSNRRYKRHSSSYFSGGTCSSCGSCMNSATSTPSLFRGGGGQYCMGKVRGGSRGGNDNPPKYYYEQNKYENDPQHQQIASRQLPNKVGGKKNKTRKMMSGGSGLHMTALSGAYGTVATYNPLYSVGDTGTSNIPAHILSGNINSNILPNPSTLQQPTNSKYNQHNRPMA